LPYDIHGPLSEVKTTRVLPSTPEDFNDFMISPTDQSISIMTSPYKPVPDFPLNLSLQNSGTCGMEWGT
jgi:hypothetical protein